MNLVLASASPQRRAILEALGVGFEVRPSSVPEREEGPPVDAATANALAKATAVASGAAGEVVLGVDTVVATAEGIWGKPSDSDEAAATLRALSGRAHEVVSGFALLAAGAAPVAGHAVTRVEFRSLSDAEISWYVACGEWEGRAGGYALQGRGGALVRRVDGDHLNVVGLPVAALLDLGHPALRLGGGS